MQRSACAILIAILALACIPADASAKWTRLHSPNFLFIGEVSGNLVYRARLKPNGVGLTALRAEENLATWTEEKPFGRPLA